MTMACKNLVAILIIVSLFGLHQCDDDPHPKGIERCFTRFVGKPYSLEDLCCVEAPWICFAGYLTDECIKRCPPLREGVPPSPPRRKGVAPSPPRRKGVAPSPSPMRKGVAPSPSPMS
ncbi:hypothetical protein AtNW77_Chr2g0257761 [Arabidopsis thaliana]|uniref:Uncharacterized protein n=3 Tax=Arabidopsis TaxID=3701 RepID=F4IP00_ARATH|nr:uncharacterized protein AT2G36695 [Arabidopsis thaliana]AEC09287.1 hypothetical protein AT2G36695 [Arabidopsis thaliana]KAG7643349.1 hypothetical protein ISN44_As02g031660 [Arabidopsis suecica]|eukprot:NP_973614.1 hypothetical protein AT2G36695 [Arabidopsis thaliana]